MGNGAGLARLFGVLGVAAVFLLALSGCTVKYDYCETELVKRYDWSTAYGAAYNEAFDRAFRTRMYYDLRARAKDFARVNRMKPRAMKVEGGQWIDDVYSNIAPCYQELADDVRKNWNIVFEEEIYQAELEKYEEEREVAVASAETWRRNNIDGLLSEARNLYSRNALERKNSEESISGMLSEFRRITTGTAVVDGVAIRYISESQAQAMEYEIVDMLTVEGMVAWIYSQNSETAAAQALLQGNLSSSQRELLPPCHLEVQRRGGRVQPLIRGLQSGQAMATIPLVLTKEECHGQEVPTPDPG